MPDILHWCQEDGETGWHLSDDPEFYPRSKPAKLLALTSMEMAEYLDQSAENVNAHDFCGAHKALSDLLTKTVGPTRTKWVMANLVRVNGLHGMTGVAGAEPGPNKAARILEIDPDKARRW